MPSRLGQADAVIDILVERGPSTAEQVGPELAARGATRARDPIAIARGILGSHPGIVKLTDGRWIARAGVLDRAVLPHVVTEAERDRCCLRLDPDLSVLAPLVQIGAVRSAAGEVRVVADWIEDAALDPDQPAPDRFLALPYGVGRRLVPGTLVGVCVRGGSIDLRHLGPLAPSSSATVAVIEATAERLMARPRHPFREPTLTVDALLTEASATTPSLLRELGEPIGALLQRCGLATHRNLVGHPMADWADLDRDAAVWDLVSRWDAVERARGDNPGDWTWADDRLAVAAMD
jgi:hypothetical protein